jgi:multiple sugar transport system substrate-binding protein
LGNSTKSGGEVKSIVVPTNESPWLGAYQKLAAEYTKQSGVKVDLRPMPFDQLTSQMVNDLQSGNHTYDIYQPAESAVNTFYNNKWVTPLADIDPDWKPDKAEINYDNITRWDAKKKINDPSGKLMCQPLNGNIELLMYRQDLLDKLGLKVPKTWDDVVSNGKKAQAEGASKYGFIVRAQGVGTGAASITYEFLPLLASYGGKWVKDEGTDWTPTANSPQAIAAAQELRDLTKLGPADTNTLGQAQIISTMQAGDALQAQLVAAAGAQLESKSDSNVAGKIGYAPMPAGPEGRATPSGVFGMCVAGGISKPRAAAAAKFIEWVQSKKAQLVFAENGGIPTRTDVSNSADIPQATREYLKAVNASADYIVSHVRYTFATEMLPITEKYLAQIAAGTISASDGMNAIQDELTQVIKKAGYPMGSK